jgi:hypothetical protein
MTLPVAFGNDEQKPRTQISWIIVSPKNFWAEYFYVRNIVRLVSTPHCQRLMKQKVLTVCEQSLLNPAPMLHCALFCFVARMKKEFCSNVVIVLFTYRRRRWAAGWVDGWYSDMDPFLQMVWLMLWRRHVRMDGILVFWACCTFKAISVYGWMISEFVPFSWP